MVLKKILSYFIFFYFLVYSNILNSSQIFDHETEIFINKLLLNIKDVNQFNKDIKFYIIRDTNPNAFVVSENKIIISSGLLEKSPDYISLLAVLAHEVGHLQYLHLEKRKETIEQFSKLSLISNLAIITGSMLAGEPQVLGGAIASQANINNFYLSFSREQEREADLYSINTLSKLKLPTSSLKKLLEILEKNALSKGYDEEYQKFSTHPIFRERYEIIENNSNISLSNFDYSLQSEFDFIKAKFMAYNNNENSEILKNDHKIYYDSIRSSLTGDLKTALKKINILIKKYPEYFFLLETKGDILRSHGFLIESSKFYKMVLINFPDNKYVKYKIFLDTNLKNFENKDKTNLFYNNINLIIFFPNNKYIVNKFIKIAKDLNKFNWIKFFNILNQASENNNKIFKETLFKLSEETDDKALKKTIYEYIKL